MQSQSLWPMGTRPESIGLVTRRMASRYRTRQWLILRWGGTTRGSDSQAEQGRSKNLFNMHIDAGAQVGTERCFIREVASQNETSPPPQCIRTVSNGPCSPLLLSRQDDIGITKFASSTWLPKFIQLGATFFKHCSSCPLECVQDVQ